MIIDFHTHLGFYKLYPKQFLEGLGNISNLGKNHVNRMMEIFLNDEDGTKLLKQMDEEGIDKSILLIIDGELGLGKTILDIKDIYKIYYKILRAHQDRFVVFAGIDPRRGRKGLELFKKSIDEYGFRGLKLYPPMGFSLKSSLLDEYFEICYDRNLIVLIHSGPSLTNMENQNSDENNILDVIKTYKDVTFVLAHAGYQYPKLIIENFLLYNKNVYFDLSGFQSILKFADKDTIEQIEHIFQSSINEHILYGSDWPLFNLFTPIKQHLDLLKDIFRKSSYSENLNALDNVFYKNAIKIL